MRTTVCLAFFAVGMTYLLPNDTLKGIAFLVCAAIAFDALKPRSARKDASEEEQLPSPEPDEPDYYLYKSDRASRT